MVAPLSKKSFDCLCMSIGITPGGPFRHDITDHDIIDRNFALGMFLNLGWVVKIVEAVESLGQEPPKFGPLLCFLIIANDDELLDQHWHFRRVCAGVSCRLLPFRFVLPPVLWIGDQTIAMFRCQADRFRPVVRNQQRNRLRRRGVQFCLHGVVFCVVHDVFAARQCTDDTNRFGKSVAAFLPVRPFTGCGRVCSTPHSIRRQERRVPARVDSRCICLSGDRRIVAQLTVVPIQVPFTRDAGAAIVIHTHPE